MIGIGTVINVAGIVGGGLVGLLFKNFFTERIQDTLMKATALSVMFMGIAGTVQKILYIEDGVLSTRGTLVLLGSMALGALIGELLNLEHQLERFGIWLREKTGNADDSSFLNGFLTASFTVCIGAMAIVGALEEGMTGEHTVLLTKAMIDFLTILILSTSLGKGCIFAAIPVFIFQESVTFLAKLLAPVMTDLALDYISMTGSILIFCVGVNLMRQGTFKVANMLPAILVAAILGMFGL